MMINFKNIKISQQVTEGDAPYSVFYFEDDRGRDWYTLRDKTWAGETAFIAVTPDGFIATGARDPNFLTLTEGVSVYEILAEDYRDDIGVNAYRYEQGKIVQLSRSESDIAGVRKTELLAQAAAAIAPLQDAIDLGIATDTEINLLAEWKKYRVLLSRVDISQTDGIEWPEIPPVA